MKSSHQGVPVGGLGRPRARTAASSARWANAIIAANDDQHRLARDAQYRHIVGLRSAIATIDTRSAASTADTLTVAQRKGRRAAKSTRGYATPSGRFAKQQRLQHLRGELASVQADRAAHRVHVVEGGKRLAKARHHLHDAGLTADPGQCPTRPLRVVRDGAVLPPRPGMGPADHGRQLAGPHHHWPSGERGPLPERFLGDPRCAVLGG
jgi:hypothetical protein